MSGAGSGIAGNQGSSSFAALELLANPTQLQAKIDSLKAAEERANKVIALAGPATEIIQLRDKAGQLHEEAVEAVKSAQEEAEGIIGFARDEAVQIVDKATQEANSLTSQAEAGAAATERAHQEVATKIAAVNQQLRNLEQQEKTLDDYKAKVDTALADIESRESILLQEKSKLATVREQIDQVLG